MKIIRFEDQNGRVRHGRLIGDDMHSVEILSGDLFGPAGLAPTGEHALVARVLAPLTPLNLLCIGLNYRRHAAESNMAEPERPVLFLKPTTSVTGHESPITLPADGPDEVDYECELAVVIGKSARDVSEADALDYVLGYTAANDVSARDWQLRHDRQWARGKGFDTFCPLGPVLVTTDDIPDPGALGIRTYLNGEIVQNSHTSDMIFSVPAIIAYLSRGMTLAPGTVILTGTPEGVGMGRTPTRYLRAGDRCEVELEGIGTLRNTVTGPTAA